jgi:hypothetical protein
MRDTPTADEAIALRVEKAVRKRQQTPPRFSATAQ